MSYDEILLYQIAKLAQGENICDDYLYRLLLNQGCYFLLSKVEKHTREIVSSLMLNSAIVYQRYKLCEDVFDELADLPYAHIKGGALSLRLYQKIGYRSSSDIDLLVSQFYLEKVKSILHSHGFVQGRLIDRTIIPFSREELIYQKCLSHQLAPFIKYTGNALCPYINIDVNQSIIWGESDIAIDTNEVVSHTEDFEIHDIRMRCLNPVWEFIALCLHHYKDMNSIYLLAENGLNLSEYCDIYFYIINVMPDIGEITRVSKAYGLSEYVYYCLYYAHEIFKDDRLLIYLNMLDSDSARNLINKYGLANSERKEWNIPFYERLLDSDFKKRFRNSLNESDNRKIDLNRHFM